MEEISYNLEVYLVNGTSIEFTNVDFQFTESALVVFLDPSNTTHINTKHILYVDEEKLV